jgi:hypothetical protein
MERAEDGMGIAKPAVAQSSKPARHNFFIEFLKAMSLKRKLFIVQSGILDANRKLGVLDVWHLHTAIFVF